MKKFIFIALAAAAAALSFSSCQKNEFVPAGDQVTGENFTIYADFTKTTIDGLSTKWAAGDDINVFHAEAEGTAYSSNSQFTISEEGLATGQFTGTLSGELAASNDWYALYPYNSYVDSPANTNGYKNIGSSYKTTAEVQNGNNSTAHLAGQYFPLYAKTANVAKNGKVTLAFKPALSIVKFHVTNGTAKAITVSTISMTAQEDIIGSYYINFAGATPTFTASGANYVEKTAKLSVASGEEIAAGDTANFYLAIKPFTNEAGNTLTFNVNGQERTSTAAATFECGKVKTVNFTYDKQEKDFSVENVAVLAKNGDKYYAMSGEPGTSSFMPEAEVAYDGTAATVKVTGDQFVWTIAKTESGYTFQNKSNSKYLSYSGTNNYAFVVETLAEECYMTILEDGGYVNVINKKVSTRVLRNNHDATRFAFYDKATGSNTLLFVKANVDSTPILNPITSPEKVAAAGATGVSVSYTVTNPVAGRVASASASGIDWITNFNCTTFGTITFDVAANTGDERSATVTVTYEGAAASQTFTVTQNAASGAAYTLDTSTAGSQGTNNTYAGNCDVTVSGIKWNVTGNSTTKPWRIGGKSITATDRTVYSKTAYPDALSKIVLTLGSANNITINSLKLEYSTSEDFTGSTTITASTVVTSGQNVFQPEGGFPKNCFYRFTLNVTVSGSSNKYVEFSKVEFYSAE